MKNLQGYFDTLLEETPLSFHRYMFNRIDWDNRLIGGSSDKCVVFIMHS